MVVWEVVRFFFLNMQNTTSTVQTGKRKDLTARGARGKAASTAREAENQTRYRDKNLCGTKPLVLPSQRSTSKLLPLDPLRATRGPLTQPGHVPHVKVNSLASCALHAKGEVQVHSVVGWRMTWGYLVLWWKDRQRQTDTSKQNTGWGSKWVDGMTC